MSQLSPIESDLLRQTVKSFFVADAFKQKGIALGFDVNATFTSHEFGTFSSGFIAGALNDVKIQFESYSSWDVAKQTALVDTASSMLTEELRQTCKLAAETPLYYPPSNGLLSKVFSWLFG